MTNYAKTLTNINQNKKTPQTLPIPGRENDQIANNAGGYSFKVNAWDMLDRFLILGTEGPTYYVSERDLTKENIVNIQTLIKEDGVRVVNRVIEISDSGRAPKNDPALYVLALASAATNEHTRKAAMDALPQVARIGTHLFHYAAFVEGFRGWGRGLRTAIANWYLDMPIDKLANQAIKYQSRDGWSHRDLLRLSHPESNDPQRDAIFRWMVGGADSLSLTERTILKNNEKIIVSRPDRMNDLHHQIKAFEEAKKAIHASEIVKLIIDYDLPREAIPTTFLNDATVWEALLVKMPITAMIRNLATMTRVGLLSPMSDAQRKIKTTLSDQIILKKSRIHPIAILSAMMTYSAGRGTRGQNTWTPVTSIIDSLDNAFYLSFGNIDPSNKPTLLALDVSGSMAMGEIAGVIGLTPRVASAALALITANVEPSYEIIGFTSSGGGWGRSTNSGVSTLTISPKQRLNDVIKTISGLPFGGTDCAQPMIWAEKNLRMVESFAVYTDSETYQGTIHASQALKQYRQSTGKAGKLAVLGMTSNGFTIADPKDSGMLDLVGMDSNTPQIMADFFK